MAISDTIRKKEDELGRYNYIIGYFNQNPHRATSANSDYNAEVLLTRDETIKSLGRLNRLKDYLTN